jgi:flagellin
MSFRINNNIPALGAYNNVSKVTMDLNRSQGKLSSGLRIADAGDDPAGLVASELFRSHITSMDAAIRNNQEATNYAKTAENGLGEVNKLLTEARGLIIASGNTSTLSTAQIAANQDQLNSIIGSINRISSNTAYGNRKLLDGSAGVSTQVSNNSKVSGFSFTGSVSLATGSVAIATNGLITVQQTVAATRALYTATATLSTGAINSGSVSLNGVAFNITAGTSGATMASTFNAASAQTGVTANWDATANQLTFRQNTYGNNKNITFSDTTGVVSAAVNTNASVFGVAGVAQVNFGAGNVLMTGSRNGNDGLTLTDAAGNSVSLAEGGNAITAAGAVGRVVASDSTFQIGIQAGQTANLALRNTSAAQLGTAVATGITLANIDISTAANIATALRVVDASISEVASTRGRIGNFQRNTLESNNRSLASMRENLTASESSIRDLDVADEMTKYTKYQVMQQAGMAMLGQANQSGQGVLSLLRG